MVFLIFVATFVTLACLVVPLATLAVFAAIERSDRVPTAPTPEGDQASREPAASREGKAATASVTPSVFSSFRRDRAEAVQGGSGQLRPTPRRAGETVVT